MKTYNVILITLLFVLFTAISNATAQTSEAETYLQKALNLEMNGEFEKALQKLADAKKNLETPHPDLAHEYLRISTEHGEKAHYKLASVLFEWAYKYEYTSLDTAAIARELERMKPVISDDKYENWLALLRQEDPAIISRMAAFWKSMDPTPDTYHNERLLEHWERIAYARENFVLKELPPYGTDERGPVYVKYGEPDREFSDYLEAEYGQVLNLLRRFVNGSNYDLLAMMEDIMAYHHEPFVEIWSYDKPVKEMEHNLIHIFGENAVGEFGKLNSIENVLSRGALSFSSNYSRRSTVRDLGFFQDVSLSFITPGAILQYHYYMQLYGFDLYFSEALNSLESGLDDDIDSSSQNFVGQQNRSNNIWKLMESQESAPVTESTEIKKLPEIPIEVFPYRILDENEDPAFVVFLESDPFFAIVEDISRNMDRFRNEEDQSVLNTENYLKNYMLVHGVHVLDGEFNTVALSTYQPDIQFNQNLERIKSGSVFVLPYKENEGINLKFFTYLRNTDDKTISPEINIFTNEYRGLGILEKEQPEPLDVKPGELTVSDLIIGYGKVEEPGDAMFPFTVSNDKKIARGENLMIHYEVYQLKQDEDGLGKFEVEYELIQKKFFGLANKNRDDLNVTLDFTLEGSRFVDNIEIETAGLSEGTYELKMVFKDVHSGESIEKSSKLEITEAVIVETVANK